MPSATPGGLNQAQTTESCEEVACLAATQTPAIGSGATVAAQSPGAPHSPGETPALRTPLPTEDLCPTAAAVGIPCPTFVAVFGNVATPEAFPTPTALPGTPVPIEPVDTAGMIQVSSWSPDGKWLAYWSSTPAEVQAAQSGQPSAALTFYHADDGEGCQLEGINHQGKAAQVEWTAQNEVIVTLADEGVYRGLPCQAESFRRLGLLEKTPVPTAYPAVSLGGEYLVESEQTANENGILTFTTRLLPSGGGLAVVEKSWRIDERLGDYGGFLGGEWISPEEFLIYETLDEGPLILDADGEVTPVLQDLFDITEVPSMLDPDGYNLAARPITGSRSGDYHLLLYAVGVETNFPDVRLYHGEYDLSETLPFRYIHGISPNGNWLLMDLRPTIEGYEASAIYFRPLELVYGDWFLLAYDQDDSGWNEREDEMAYASGDVLTWQDFPDLNLRGRWQAGANSGYNLQPSGGQFSPDGCRLALAGYRSEQAGNALFVVDRCP